MTVDEQVDDNGESYWIFESRDVRNHSSSHLFYPLNALREAVTACQSYRLSVRTLLCIRGRPSVNSYCPQGCFGLRYTFSRPSGLVSFLSPCLSSIYRQSSEFQCIFCPGLTWSHAIADSYPSSYLLSSLTPQMWLASLMRAYFTYIPLLSHLLSVH